MKKFLVVLLAAVFCLGCFASGASAMLADHPLMLQGCYWHADGVPMVNLFYYDPARLEWIEVYLLEEGEAAPNMGTLEAGGKAYTVIGIQTIDVNRPGVLFRLNSGITVLETDLYLGDCPLRTPGSPVFITVGLTDPATQEEILLDPVPVTVPEDGNVINMLNPYLFGGPEIHIDPSEILFFRQMMK